VKSGKYARIGRLGSPHRQDSADIPMTHLLRPANPWLHVTMHLQDALAAFQVQLLADGRSEHTRKQYERHTRSMIAWLEDTGQPTEIADVTPVIVAEFFASDSARLSARGGAKRASSANAQRTSIRCWLRWAHESGLVASNPARLLKRARCAPGPPKSLRGDEQERLLKVLDDATGDEAARDRMLVSMLLKTGIRIGSALALDVEDIDLAHGELTLRSTKNDNPATAVMPATLVTALTEFLGDRTTGPVFLAGTRRISTRHVQRRICNWLRKAKVTGRSVHSLRHTFACDLLARTGDLRLVQAAMNHRSVVSTTIYAQVSRERLREAVGA
jgi:integrase/recombinase XerC